jgi:hypothetical protein
MPYPLGVHEALQAWQDGEITYRRCPRLLGVDTIADLYAGAGAAGCPSGCSRLKLKCGFPTGCVYRKLKLGRSGGEVRQGWRVI